MYIFMKEIIARRVTGRATVGFILVQIIFVSYKGVRFSP